MKTILISLSSLVLAAACASVRPEPIAASARLDARSGSNVSGMVRFEEVMEGGVPAVRVTIDAAGVPAGTHGFHVHEKGDCSAPDAATAGGHFNPANAPHGAPGAAPHHAGDFGNVAASADGKVKVTYVMPGVTLGSGSSSITGKAVILHANPDDLKTQPTGNAGGRIACGVIALEAL